MDSLFRPDGVCRVMFASTALGMGVNVRCICFVIHYGPPRQMDYFIEEMVEWDGTRRHQSTSS